jgi:DNA-binding ferritin-like protein (Dps family)
MNNILSTEKELELINKHTRTPLTADDVYTFTVTLCDNEIDRDFECFSLKSLQKLTELFVGKTGIADHSMLSKDQSARIFYCYTETDTSKKTSEGEAYTSLKARAYTLKNDSNKDFISSIEGGIRKEVSIGCAVSRVTCSICGKDMKTHSCQHIKGKTYKGKLCYGILEEPNDAYEWSFVAVPAQRNAGVTKSFTPGKEMTMDTTEIIKSMTEGSVIGTEKAKELSDYIDNLEALAKQAQCYKEHLTKDIARFAGIIMPQVNTKQFTENCMNMDLDQLRKFRDDMQKQAGSVLPVSSQIRSSALHAKDSNKDFII